MKKILLVIVCLTMWLSVFGYSFQVEGIYYNIIGVNEVEVTTRSGVTSNYSGSIVIPSSVYYLGKTYSITSIGYCAFQDCSGLTSITIPTSVTSIGADAFQDCSGLTSITIPTSVTSIGADAFQGCSGLTSISVDANNTHYDSRNNCNAIIETATNTLIQGCMNTIIPNSVTSIGNNAFSYCFGLTSITIPANVTSIAAGAFSWCSGLTSISVDADNTHYDSRNNCNAIIETATNTLIRGCKNTIIPNNVTTIGKSVFTGCVGLKSITIPNSVTAIDDEAFNGTGLTSVNVPNSVTYVGFGAFAYCDSLTSLILPNSVTYMGACALYHCGSLTSFNIPNGVTSIRPETFYKCTGLVSVNIPDGIDTIESNAFAGCGSLTSITIPNSVTFIGNYAFSSCESLTSITVMSRALSSGINVFNNCPNVTSLTISSSVTSIGSIGTGFFAGLWNLTEITCYATTPPTIQSNTFSNYDATLYVPSNSISIYLAKAYWKNFFIQPISGASHSITVTSNDEQKGITIGGGTYEENTNAQLIAVTQAGYSFQRWSDGNTDNPRNIVVTNDSTFTAIFSTASGENDTIYLEYDGKEAMQYALEEHGVYYFNGKVYNQQNLYIKLYYSDGKLISSGQNDIDMSGCVNGIYIVTDGKGGFLKVNHYR